MALVGLGQDGLAGDQHGDHEQDGQEGVAYARCRRGLLSGNLNVASTAPVTGVWISQQDPEPPPKDSGSSASPIHSLA